MLLKIVNETMELIAACSKFTGMMAGKRRASTVSREAPVKRGVSNMFSITILITREIVPKKKPKISPLVVLNLLYIAATTTAKDAVETIFITTPIIPVVPHGHSL